MESLPDAVIGHLREAVSRPDFAGTRYEITEELEGGGMGTGLRRSRREARAPRCDSLAAASNLAESGVARANLTVHNRCGISRRC